VVFQQLLIVSGYNTSLAIFDNCSCKVWQVQLVVIFILPTMLNNVNHYGYSLHGLRAYLLVQFFWVIYNNYI